MAKRKRLEMPTEPISPELETKSAFPAPRSRMPIAEVAGDTAGRAALEEVAREMTAAEEEGRVVKRLPISGIGMLHFSRDRMHLDEDDMEVLKASLKARGQQTPIEVVRTGGGYELISGFRRIEALRALGESHVLALVRKPQGATGAYQAMVEENEIRADLSFYERANIAVVCTGQGVYPNPKRAVADLFAHAPSAKRSKILRFLVIREQLGRALTFPAAIPEKLGLRLASALEADAKLANRIADVLRKTPPEDAAAERRALERALRKEPASKPDPEEIAPGIRVEAKKGRAVLTGPGVDAAFLEGLRAFAVSHAKGFGVRD